jgi:outer membrane lipoprotein LolB
MGTFNSPRWWAAFAATTLVAGCAALSPPRAPATPVPFDLIGRVAVSYDGRSFFSNVRWHHTQQRDEIWLQTPAGQTLAHIVSDGDGATLTGADRSEYSGADVESLTREGLGWELPLNRLGWWVRGEAVPGTPAQNVERDEHTRLVALTQDGWRVTLTRDAQVENNPLPRRIEVAGEGHVIRLVVDRWRSADGS